MKKLLYLLMFSLFVVAGCSSEEVSEEKESDVKETISEKESEESQEESDEKRKDESVPMVIDEVEEGESVHAKGKVEGSGETVGIGDTFILKTEEENEYGVFLIYNLTTNEGIQDGDNITVYGTYDGEDEETGLHIINGTVIEKE